MKKWQGWSIVFCLALIAFTLYYLSPNNYDHKYLLPQGYTGWVEITFDQPDSPPLEREGKSYVYEIPADGKLQTSTTMKSGTMLLYYVGADGQRTRIGLHESMNHGGGTSSGEEHRSDGTVKIFPTKVTFFVGTEDQWKQNPTAP
ncbi:DUF6843 domain-containing protein [Paenibacillus eucommiae]|uniref:DUF6843 domain-containing protein n=1 Tax=Paenibacillus eucommiae TaxID=1355755 RepID=A0ABS4INN2_9BACL|nr:hypothetical protein [Paenibacillus eucommiae]MBP1988636.1 hypothetical protein [Paenibacillus eucommiae]